MLAINAPPGQGPTRQPFVHYRCLCSSPGPSASASDAHLAAQGKGETEDHGETGVEATMDIDSKDKEKDRAATPTSSSPGPSSSSDLVPFSASSPLSSSQQPRQKSPTTLAGVHASGNNSDGHGSQSLSRLYFCDSCDEVRCPKCVQDEIVCYYCPNCLFDVPTASVKSEKHK